MTFLFSDLRSHLLAYIVANTYYRINADHHITLLSLLVRLGIFDKRCDTKSIYQYRHLFDIDKNSDRYNTLFYNDRIYDFEGCFYHKKLIEKRFISASKYFQNRNSSHNSNNDRCINSIVQLCLLAVILDECCRNTCRCHYR